MRNKLLVEKKLEKLESMISNIQFSINRGERDSALRETDSLRDQLEAVIALVQNEDQDERY